MIMLIAVRMHYTIDMVGALIVVGYIFHYVKVYLKYCDMVFNFPFWALKKVYFKIKPTMPRDEIHISKHQGSYRESEQ